MTYSTKDLIGGLQTILTYSKLLSKLDTPPPPQLPPAPSPPGDNNKLYLDKEVHIHNLHKVKNK